MIGRRVGEEKTLDATTIYQAAKEQGLSNVAAAVLIEAIMKAEEEVKEEVEI